MTKSPRVASSRSRPARAWLALFGAIVPCLVAHPAAGRPDDPPELVGPPAPDLDAPELAGRFEGRVVGPSGEPVPGARLYLVRAEGPADGPGPVRARADADGKFAFDAPDLAPPGTDGLPLRRPGLLIAAADGFAPDAARTWGWTAERYIGNGTMSFGTPPAPRRATTNLRLARADVAIRGQVLGPTGAPVAGARVRLTGMRFPRDRDLDAPLAWPDASASSPTLERWLDRPELLPGVDHAAVADAAGRFRLAGLGRDRLAMLALAGPGVVETTAEVMVREVSAVLGPPDADGFITSGIHGAEFSLRLPPSRTLTGVVRDRVTKQPIAGMWVGNHSFGALKTAGGIRPVRTDGAGRFAVEGVDPRQWANQVVPPNMPDMRFTLDATPAPGMPFRRGRAVVDRADDLVIECARGIPFRLAIVDEAGVPVDAAVEVYPLSPNPLLDADAGDWRYGYDPISVGARRGPGVYEGCVVAGPGAVLVGPVAGFRPAHVDPKGFFAPGRTEWTAQERISAYGTQDTLACNGHWRAQADYAAIVLVDPPVDSPPLELRATLVRDRPRTVTLVDPAGAPVVGVETRGLTASLQDDEPRLRAATFPLLGIPPGLNQRIVFTQPERRLIGFLNARAEQVAPVTVQLRPWGTVTGRLVTRDGAPLPPAGPGTPLNILELTARFPFGTDDLMPLGGISTRSTQFEPDGRFRLDRLAPGLWYSARAYREFGKPIPAFEEISPRPGEVVDLGDIPTSPDQDPPKP